VKRVQQNKATNADLATGSGVSATIAGGDDPSASAARIAQLEAKVAEQDNLLYELREEIAQHSIRLMDALESLSEGFVLLNADLDVIIINERVGDLFRAHGAFWEPGSALDANLKGLEKAGLIFYRDEKPAPSSEIIDAVADGRDIDLLVTDLAESWITFDLRATTDPGFVVTFQDIADLKRSERDLRTQGALLQATLDSIGQGICAFDDSGRLIAVNPLFGTMLMLPAHLLEKGTPRVSMLAHLKENSLIDPDGRDLDVERLDRDRRDGRLLTGFPMVVGDRHLEVTQSPMVDGGYVSTVTDVTERRQAQEMLVERATLDALTGLPNRAVGLDRLKATCAQAKRTGNRAAAMFIDLDGFKYVNDTFGHHVGDVLIVESGRRMESCLRRSDTVARLGGDEFLIIIGDLTETGHIETVAEKLLKALSSVFAIEGNEIFVSASIGAAVYPDDTEDPFLLLNHADRAMYAAKESGKNAYQYFSPHMNVGRANRLRVENDFRVALEREQLRVYYQPIVDCKTGQAIGAEALTRWPKADGGFFPPDQFMPIIEDTPLIVPFGEWVLRQACHDGKAWIDELGRPLSISVNISPRQFRDKSLIPTVATVLQESGLPPACLKLEVTENIMAQDVSGILEIMLKLNEIGVSLSMDDFGTGYSSLRYIKDFPFKTLKIDKAFVQGVPANQTDVALASTIIAMARSLGINVIAEGVETEEQHAFLIDHDCDLAQGYLFGRPEPGQEFLSVARRPAQDETQFAAPPTIDSGAELDAIAELSALAAELSGSNSKAAAALDKALASIHAYRQKTGRTASHS